MMPKIQRGMTLIELLVAMAIGLMVTLVVTTLLVAGENHKRTTTSTNDAEQSGSYAFHALDKALRAAGSGFAESAYQTDRGIMGCNLNVTSPAAGTILPRGGAFPPPFANFLGGAGNTLRVAPVLIAQNQSPDALSDVLVVMGGSGMAGGVSRPIFGAGSNTSLVLETGVGFNSGDIALVSQSGPVGGDCLLEQITNVGGATLTVGGGAGTYYYTANGTTTNLATLANNFVTGYVTPLGNVGLGNVGANNVLFQLFGVDSTTDTLYSYDLLQNQRLVQGTGGDTPQAITDGVVKLKALYGIQGAAPGVLSGWVTPSGGVYGINAVMNSPATMESIIAVHVALIVRGEYMDKNPVSPAQVTIFNGFTTPGGASLAQPVNIPDQRYRYRVFEFTVPLRNMLLLAT